MNQVVDKLIEAGEKKVTNCSVFLDLAKVFNMVNHKILISKLKNHNIRCSMLNLLKDYLKQRFRQTASRGPLSKYCFNLFSILIF